MSEGTDDFLEWARDYPSPRLPKPEGTFEVAFCMAGAVSAGAYTAGVLDVFFEALDALTAERAARQADGRKPLHQVQVPVFGGASAGGMCAAIAAIFADRQFPPIHPDTPEADRADNPLWRAWVQDIDIAQMLGTRDVRPNAPIKSLLDCTILEEIVDRLMDQAQQMPPAHRPWLASPLRAVLTLSNLRGVPYALGFEGKANFRHWMSQHADYVRFAIPLDSAAGAAPEDKPKVGETILDRFAPRRSQARADFMAVALGTGAFPVALAPRILRRPTQEYRYRAGLTPTGPFREAATLDPRPAWADAIMPAWRPQPPAESYTALCVDGGAMNNEPLDLVRRVLVGHGASTPKPADIATRALMLIDPFVNPGSPGPDQAQGLIGSIMPLFNALVQNARFKPEDLAAAADPNVGSRFLIAPSRGEGWEAEGAIAAGHLGGFMGFFSQAYREHDFFLGRRNALRFLRNVFVLPETNPLFKEDRWSDNDRIRWGVTLEGATPGRHLPIIPLCGPLYAAEEPLPKWPVATDYPAARIRKLVAQRAAVAVPGLRQSVVAMMLSRPGFWNSLGRGGVWALEKLLRPRLVEGVVEKLEAEAAKLAAVPAAHRKSSR